MNFFNNITLYDYTSINVFTSVTQWATYQGNKGRRDYRGLFDGPVLMQSWVAREGGITGVCLMALS